MPIISRLSFYDNEQPMIYQFSSQNELKIALFDKLYEPENIYDMVELDEKKMVALIC